eukprot:Tbor_TRINITY_DN2578_c0_g1::TRINITY_DN2578_c0_g1_i1::g.438::m.438
MMLGSSSWLNEITANVPENATSLRELYDKLLFTNGGRVGRVHSLRTPQQPRASVRLSVSCNNYQQNNKYWTAEGDQQRPGLISNVPISNQLVISNVSGNINEQNHDRDNKTASTREPPTVVGSLLQHQTRNMTNLNGSLLNHSKKSNDNDPVSSTNSSSTIHDSVATLTALLSNFELHADQQTQIEEELHNSRVENNRLQQCITSIKREYQCEIAGLKQDNCTLQEINSKIKAAALEEASRHATELSRAMRLLEERQQVIDELKKENSTLAGRLKRQEAKTQQILGMLQSD